MEGIDRLAVALRQQFGSEPFCVQDALMEIPREAWSASTRAQVRQRSQATSMSKAVARVPGAERVHSVKRVAKIMWRVKP